MRHEYSEQDKGRIAVHAEQGMSARAIAKLYGWKKTRVAELVKEYQATGGFTTQKANRAKCGRKRKTSPQTDRYIARSVVGSKAKRRKGSNRIAKELQVGGVADICARTVRLRLCEVGLNGRVAAKKPMLRLYNITRRLQWARDHADWTTDDWERVLWSDESKFVIWTNSGRRWVRRRTGERLRPDCVNETVKGGGGKVMVWGCFCAQGVRPLKRIFGNMDGPMYKSILVYHARPALKHFGLSIFQEDNDPKHTAKKNKAYMAARFPAQRMPWPAQSPDLAPIENLWAHLDQRMQERPGRPTSVDGLFEALQEEWAKITPDFLRNLAHSMPARCAAVIKAKGYWIKY